MRYCPKCGAEYLDHISSCSDCNVDLVDTPPEADEQPQQMPVEYVSVDYAFNRIELALVQAALKEAGIHYRFSGGRFIDEILSQRLEIYETELQISLADVDRARKIIEGIVNSEPLEDDMEVEGEQE